VILIPVKNLSSAKRRLAAVLDQSARTELAQAMLHDVVAALGDWPHHPACALVTSDPFAMDLARQYDFDIIEDAANAGETAAVEMATRFILTHGAKSSLVIPGDIPLIQADELEQILKRAPQEGAVLVPAADGRGTNAAFRRPGGLFPLRFGNDSFKPHLAAAQATGLPCEVLQLPGIALDVDNPEDLRELLARPGEARCQKLLRQWSLTADFLSQPRREHG
jgi:2-phospho-L-lactate guanylyltransferase